MAETPPYGEKFGKSVKHILHREGQWNLWKNQGCKSLISKPTVAEEDIKKEDGAESKDSNNAALSTIPIFYTMGSFSNYVDRILPFFDPPPPVWKVFVP